MPETATAFIQHYTYGDYRTWPNTERWELIHGIAVAMTAPLRIHQRFVSKINTQIDNYLTLKKLSCQVYPAPFEVRLTQANENDNDIDTVVEPDIAVICDLNKLDKYGCRGAPDCIVEVISPSTALRDQRIKRDLYQQHAVREYWIVHPIDRIVIVYILENGKYKLPHIYAMDYPVASVIFPDLTIDWTGIE